MDILEIIKTRRSIRSFDSARPVRDKDINKLLEAAIWAPSGGNVQPWKFLVVTNEEVKKSLCKAAYDQEYIVQAPYSIAICIDIARASSRYRDRGLNLYSIQDTAAAVQNILLTAHDMGLGTVWIGAFDEKEASKVLKLEKNLRPVAIIPIGYAKEKPLPPPRHSIEKVTEWIR